MLTAATLRTLFHLLKPASRSPVHAERLAHFYQGQARDYDAFRARLLPGRRTLVTALPLSPGAVWVDLGGGTAHLLSLAGPALGTLRHAVVVDLTTALLAIAGERRRQHGWTNVTLLRADATRTPLPDGIADVVTMSYSLTMVPQWTAVIDEAERLLRPGGTVGCVDFYVSAADAAPLHQHSALTRRFWPWWFAHRHVHLSPDHLAALLARFTPVRLQEDRAPVPFLPGGRVPYYIFIGRRSTPTRS